MTLCLPVDIYLAAGILFFPDSPGLVSVIFPRRKKIVRAKFSNPD